MIPMPISVDTMVDTMDTMDIIFRPVTATP